MKRPLLAFSFTLLLSQPVLATTGTPTMPNTKDDALLAEWTGAHRQFPRFDQMHTADLKTAIAHGMELNRAELAAITNSKEPATFTNTIAAFDLAGRPASWATAIFDIHRSNLNDKGMQVIETDLAPILAAFNDEVTQNGPLFARVKTVYDARATLKLTPEQKRLVQVTYEGFARRGAALNAGDKAKLKDINRKLATLFY